MRKLVALQSACQGDARVGSISGAAWIARVGFLTLITIGIWSGDLRRRGATIFIVLGLAVWLGPPERAKRCRLRHERLGDPRHCVGLRDLQGRRADLVRLRV